MYFKNNLLFKAENSEISVCSTSNALIVRQWWNPYMVVITVKGEWSVTGVRVRIASTWNGNLRRAPVAGGVAGVHRRAGSPANSAWCKSHETREYTVWTDWKFRLVLKGLAQQDILTKVSAVRFKGLIFILILSYELRLPRKPLIVSLPDYICFPVQLPFLTSVPHDLPIISLFVWLP